MSGLGFFILAGRSASYDMPVSAEFVFLQRGVLLDADKYECSINLLAEWGTITCSRWLRPWSEIEFTLLVPKIIQQGTSEQTKTPGFDA